MAQETRTLTAEDLFWMPDDPAHRYELVRGRLVTMSPGGGLHSAVGVRLANAIGRHVDLHGLGVVLGADCGFRLESDPDTVRAPDAAFVTRARIAAAGVPTGYWEGPPDLAVEVLSPSDSRAELRSKIAEYLRLGVQEVWFVEPVERRLTVHGRPGGPQILSELDTLDGGDLLPGFSYSLSRLFSFDA